MGPDGAVAACKPCVPSAGCVSGWREWSVAHGRGFLPNKLGLKRITLELDALVLCHVPQERLVVIDVGAGIHNLAKRYINTARRLHADDSDAIWLLSTLGARAHVHAFEANPQKAAELDAAAAARPQTANLTAHLTVHPMGVGGSDRSDHVARCGFENEWTVAGNDGKARPDSRCRRGAQINVTSLDNFVASLGDVTPLYIKVDVEGGEWDVLKGMHSLLRRRAVPLLSFEYAVRWHPLFARGRGQPVALRADERNLTRHRSLARFQQKLSAYGYDTYLINAGDRSSGVALVPVHDDFWHEDFEICANRTRYYYHPWCWNDLLVVRRCDACTREALFGNVLRRTHESLYRWRRRAAPPWKPPVQSAAFVGQPRGALGETQSQTEPTMTTGGGGEAGACASLCRAYR